MESHQLQNEPGHCGISEVVSVDVDGHGNVNNSVTSTTVEQAEVVEVGFRGTVESSGTILLASNAALTPAIPKPGPDLQPRVLTWPSRWT